MSALQFALSVNNGQETKTFQESVAGPFVVDGKFSKRSPVKRRKVFLRKRGSAACDPHEEQQPKRPGWEKLGWGDDCCRRALALFLLFYVILQVVKPSASPTKRICLKRELVGQSPVRLRPIGYNTMCLFCHPVALSAPELDIRFHVLSRP